MRKHQGAKQAPTQPDMIATPDKGRGKAKQPVRHPQRAAKKVSYIAPKKSTQRCNREVSLIKEIGKERTEAGHRGKPPQKTLRL